MMSMMMLMMMMIMMMIMIILMMIRDTGTPKPRVMWKRVGGGTITVRQDGNKTTGLKAKSYTCTRYILVLLLLIFS